MDSIKKLPEKISRIILKYDSLLLKFHVKLNDENNSLYYESKFGDKTYISSNPNGYLTIELPKMEGNMFDLTRSFMVGQGNIGSVVKTMKNVLKNIYKEEIFALQNNKVIIYEDMAVKYSGQINIPRLGQGLLIKPAVVYDENEVSYEGVHIYVNKSSNVAPLSIEEFENLVYTLEKIDIFVYSQMLINYFISFINNYDTNKSLVNGDNGHTIYNKPQINWENNKKETIVSNYVPIKNNDDLFEGL